MLDDGKEKDDRKERDRDRDREQREREKEKEPAWMDTYIPTGPGAGILGGKGSEGELDGIQAFKKGMKAKEQKDLPSSGEMLERADVDGPNGSSKIAAPSSTLLSEKPLDEIQLFKLMMKMEQEQKMPQKLQTSVTEPTLTGPSLQEIENGGLSGIRDNRVISTPSNGTSSPFEVSRGLMCKYSQVDLGRHLFPNLSLHWNNLLLQSYRKAHLLLHHQHITLPPTPPRICYLSFLLPMPTEPDSPRLLPLFRLHQLILHCLNLQVLDSFPSRSHLMSLLLSHRTKDLPLKLLLNLIHRQDLVFWHLEPATPQLVLAYRIPISHLCIRCTDYIHLCNSTVPS